MMKTNFTLKSRYIRLFSLMVMGMISILQSSGQAPSCACKGGPINVTLGTDGYHDVTPAEVMASPNSCGGTTGTVTIMSTLTGAPIAGSPRITCDHIGKTLYAKYSNGGNSCWTTISPIEDKLAPTITCQPNMTITCVDMANFTPTVSDNCPAGLSWAQVGGDIVVNNNCSSNFAPNVIKRITRTYVATDGSGNKSTPCTTVFDVTTIPSLNDIVMPLNWDIATGNNPALQCNGKYPRLAGNDYPDPVGTPTNPGTGTPKVGSISIFENPDLYCNLMVTYNDAKVQILNGAQGMCVTKIMRTWTVLEWSCQNRARAPYVQLIEIVDDKGPLITHAADINASTSNHKCEGVVTFLPPMAFDSCSFTALTSTITVYPNGNYALYGAFIPNGGSRTIPLPIGSHKAVYAVYDLCQNVSRDTINVTIEDNTPPVAICDEQTTIGLNTNGEAWVPASVIDDGSFDECQLAKLVVRRMTHTSCSSCPTPEFPGFKLIGERGTGTSKRWYYLAQHAATPKIAGKTATALGGALVVYSGSAQQIADERSAVRGFVQAYNPGIEFIIAGNQKDKAPSGPIVASASTDTLRYVIEIDNPCNTFNTHARFCCSDISSRPQQMVILRAIDASGNFNDCMVSVEVQDKIGPSITCPGDRTVYCDSSFDPSNLTKDFGWPVAVDNCPNPTVTIIDSTISLTSCRIGSITRRFLVTDAGGRTASCTQLITFLPDSTKVYKGPTPGQWPGPYMSTSCGTPADVHPNVTGRPVISDGVCSLVGADFIDQTFTFNNSSGPACFKILRTWTVIDWCKFAPNRNPQGALYPTTKLENTNTWTYVQEIKVVDNVGPVFDPIAPIVTADTYDATCANGNITLRARATDACTNILRWSYKIDPGNDGSFLPTVSNTGNAIDASGSYPVGTHKIVYSFEDRCGNVSTKEQLFSIVNKKTPSAIVLQGLAISLMKIADGVGMADVWAKDFDPDNKSSHPCGYEIYYSFTQATQLAQNGKPITMPNMMFDCSDVGKDTVIIWVIAVTASGDIVQSSVETFIDVQDNATPKICPPNSGRVAVNGTLTTESNQTVKDVRVSLIGSELHANTGSNGKFDFSNMPTGGKYEVTPEKNDDHINGVSTLDLIMIQRHILGLQKLESPFKLIAADVTKDGKVTAADLVELRKLILGTSITFANNKSWRFVDKAYRFADAASAQGEAFPEIYAINNLTANMTTDFVAVKTGDVNGNVKANNIENTVESRTSTRLALSTENQDFESGQNVIVPVKVSAATDINGMQFTIAFDNSALALTALDPAGINVNDSNFGLSRTGDGLLTVSWNSSKAISLKNGDVMFNITFIAKDKGILSDLLKVNSALTIAEAYTSDDKVMDIVFSLQNRGNETSGFDLKQNTPNPFKETTIIGFDLPTNMEATLTVYDISGKILRNNKIQGNKGYNTVELNKSELHSGVMYYTLKAGDYNATKKMVVIE